MSGEVEQVSSKFNELRAGDDFSGVAEQLRDLQRGDNANWKSNVADINRKVDMKALGFEEDFSILGVNQQGKVMTKSEDGQTVQMRDRTHLEVQAEKPNTVSTEKWGKREFDASGDGSATYKIKRGDNLWSIAKDTLSEQLGRAAKDSEIATHVKDIARENEIKDPNKIYAGKELKIPISRPIGELPTREKPALSPTEESVQAEDEVEARNALAAPGLGPDRAGVSDSAVGERNLVSRDRSEGITTAKYEGSLSDGLLGFNDTKFQSERITAENGALLSSRVEYDGSGANLNFADENGSSIKINQVKSIATTFNSEAGSYETTITRGNGEKYRSVTGADGQIISLRQISEAPTPDNIPLF